MVYLVICEEKICLIASDKKYNKGRYLSGFVRNRWFYKDLYFNLLYKAYLLCKNDKYSDISFLKIPKKFLN